MPELLPSWQHDDVSVLQDFAKIQLVVADLDGTLVRPSSDELSQMVQALNRKLSAPRQHVLFTIATGRALAGITPLLNQLHLKPNIPIAAYNGSLIFLPHKRVLLYESAIPRNAFRQVLRLVAKAKLPTLAYVCALSQQTEELFGSFGEEVYGWHIQRGHDRELNGLPIMRSPLLESPTLEPIAVLLDIRGVNDARTRHIRAELERVRGLSVTQSSGHYLELRPRGASKAAAVSRIAASLGIGREEVLTIGDNDNDADMLRWAGVGVAVAGASLAALQSSRYFCRHGVELGVVEVLRTVAHAKRYHRFLLGDDLVPIGGS